MGAVRGVISAKDNMSAVLRSVRQEQSAFRRDVQRTRRELESTWDQRRTARLDATAANRAAQQLQQRLQPLRRRIVTAVAIKDMVSDKIKAVGNKVKAVGKMIATPIVKLKDGVTAGLSKIKSQLTSLAKTVAIPVTLAGTVVLGGAISQGAADVLVTDGFTGNIFLKTVEGAASLFSHALKDMLLGSTKNKLAALLLKNSIGAFKKRFDANEVGGTALLGISQPVIKAHGSSNAYAFFNAIRQAQVVAQADIVGDIAANVAHMRLEPGEKEG